MKVFILALEEYKTMVERLTECSDVSDVAAGIQEAHILIGY